MPWLQVEPCALVCFKARRRALTTGPGYAPRRLGSASGVWRASSYGPGHAEARPEARPRMLRRPRKASCRSVWLSLGAGPYRHRDTPSSMVRPAYGSQAWLIGTRPTRGFLDWLAFHCTSLLHTCPYWQWMSLRLCNAGDALLQTECRRRPKKSYDQQGDRLRLASCMLRPAWFDIIISLPGVLVLLASSI